MVIASLDNEGVKHLLSISPSVPGPAAVEDEISLHPAWIQALGLLNDRVVLVKPFESSLVTLKQVWVEPDSENEWEFVVSLSMRTQKVQSPGPPRHLSEVQQ